VHEIGPFVTFEGPTSTGTEVLRPGPLRLSLENRTDMRVLPAVWIAADRLHDLLGHRKPFVTVKRLLSNQTFRDLYRTDTLDVDQRLKITSLTFLFTDLKGSTELYERVGDLAAFDLVRSHFRQPPLAAPAPGAASPRPASTPDWRCRQGREAGRSPACRYLVPGCRSPF
jgi:Family of unknown function (DUF5939)